MLIVVVSSVARTRVKRHVLRRPDRKSILSTRRIKSVRIANQVVSNSNQVFKDQIVRQRQDQVTKGKHVQQGYNDHFADQVINEVDYHQDSNLINEGSQKRNLVVKHLLYKGKVRTDNSGHSACFITVNIVRDRAPSGLYLQVGNLARRLNDYENLL